MKVGYAFQLFGDKVLQGLHLYKAEIEATVKGTIGGTQDFFRQEASLPNTAKR